MFKFEIETPATRGYDSWRRSKASDKCLITGSNAYDKARVIPEGVTLELELRPVGELRAHRLEDGTRYVQDGLHVWADGTTTPAGGWFRKDVADPGHERDDWCCYCGANNGKDGILRNGFDCCECGGN